MTTFRYLAPARGELRNAAHYYQQRSRRVAASFMVEVQKAVDQILEYPESAPEILGGVRGKVILRFPYSLMYKVVDDVVIILANSRDRTSPATPGVLDRSRTMIGLTESFQADRDPRERGSRPLNSNR